MALEIELPPAAGRTELPPAVDELVAHRSPSVGAVLASGTTTRVRTARTVVLALLVIALGALPSESTARVPGVKYYVALGDSLAAGTQPGRLFTREGYADQLYALRRREIPELRLAKLGCPGETTVSMRKGGRCPYANGSQLAEAAAFLRANRQEIAFVTLGIGANDVLRCDRRAVRCTARAFAAIRRNLTAIVRALREAAGRQVPIVGMTYYAPGLAAWLRGRAGRVQARAYVHGLVRPGNVMLRAIYARGRVGVADVERAFATRDFGGRVRVPNVGVVPRNVARICNLTWMCSRRNIHANHAGYGVIARTFAGALSRRS